MQVCGLLDSVGGTTTTQSFACAPNTGGARDSVNPRWHETMRGTSQRQRRALESSLPPIWRRATARWCVAPVVCAPRAAEQASISLELARSTQELTHAVRRTGCRLALKRSRKTWAVVLGLPSQIVRAAAARRWLTWHWVVGGCSREVAKCSAAYWQRLAGRQLARQLWCPHRWRVRRQRWHLPTCAELPRLSTAQRWPCGVGSRSATL